MGGDKTGVFAPLGRMAEVEGARTKLQAQEDVARLVCLQVTSFAWVLSLLFYYN